MPTLKLLSPENDVIGNGRACRVARRQQSHGRFWRAPANTPGSKSTSSRRSGLCGNKGDPRPRDGIDPSGCLTSLISEDDGMRAGKSELSIVALTPGNAGRAKGRQIEISVRRSMDQTLGWINP
jgi:hypothetical protein